MRRLVYAIGILAALGTVVWAFLPKPVPVDVGRVARGPMVLTVDAEGRTRIRERYVVSPPVAGRTHRVTLHPGDPVVAGKTLLVRVDPEAPGLLDERARRSAEFELQAAEAAHEQAKAQLERAVASEERSSAALERMRKLFDTRTVSRQDLDDAEAETRVAASEKRAAGFAVSVAAHEEEMARIAVECCRPESEAGAFLRPVEIRAPVGGVVLKVFQESATAVRSGVPILEIGDPRELEVEADVLSTDAVRIPAGAEATLERWGGRGALRARVRRVEPAAFTKVSALGVEEQRVWVILDLADPYEAWSALGDGYRVEVRVVVWKSEDALKVPAGALFRAGDRWRVFSFDAGRVHERDVRIGAMDPLEAEVLGGLEAGDEVILHPSDRVSDGTRVERRDASSR